VALVDRIKHQEAEKKKKTKRSKESEENIEEYAALLSQIEETNTAKQQLLRNTFHLPAHLALHNALYSFWIRHLSPPIISRPGSPVPVHSRRSSPVHAHNELPVPVHSRRSSPTLAARDASPDRRFDLVPLLMNSRHVFSVPTKYLANHGSAIQAKFDYLTALYSSFQSSDSQNFTGFANIQEMASSPTTATILRDMCTPTSSEDEPILQAMWADYEHVASMLRRQHKTVISPIALETDSEDSDS
jgi:hypothetical protein